jgi:16S rRNA (guanine(966)-N(2))-methyltransferase RsmD
MNMLAGELRGCRWLELCGGSGVMACEALQRGAAAVVLVEKDRRVAAVARANLEAVARGLAGAEEGGASAMEVVVEDAPRFLGRGARASGRGSFDLIYADPPWSAGLHGVLTRAVAAGGWLAPEGTLILECDRMAPPSLPAGWRERRRATHGGSVVLLLRQEPELEP